MITKRLYLVILLLVIGCQQSCIGQNESVASTSEEIVENGLSKQLKINVDALLKGSSEQIRVDAATVMLFSEESAARKVLLSTLKQSENIAACQAVCKALSQARAAQEPIPNKADFIAPLLEILTADDFATGKLAADATLLFEYKQISKHLENIVSDTSLPVKARSNAVYALKLQPDMRAIFKLIELLDDPEKQIAGESENALNTLGIPVGNDDGRRRQIINELKRKGKDQFLRDWVIRQEAQMRALEVESRLWQELYLSSLNKIYDNISDEASKGQFLADHLTAEKSAVRSWALEKVSQWRVGTTSKFPPQIGPILVNLVSDQDRDVRLKTAKLLSLMGELNSAEKLLEQLKIEQDDEVRTELFVAIGGACYYAFLPNSGIKIPQEVRTQTLEWAVKYLAEQDPKKAKDGAEVIKKLLEQNGLPSTEADRYLGLLVERYNQEKNSPDGTLQSDLLGAMAGLCAQSIYKAESIKLFQPLFEEGLTDATNLVREASVNGLVYIDKALALKMLRGEFVNDSSTMIRAKLIDLAGEVGGEEDLVWLAEKIAAKTESEPAWAAMLKIFKRSDAGVLERWIVKFDEQNNGVSLSDEQKIPFLEIAERKAVDENKLEMLKNTRQKLAQLYMESGEFGKAAAYLGLLRQFAETSREKETILASLLNAYLGSGNLEAAGGLVANQLLEKDLAPNDVVILVVDDYLAKLPAATDSITLLNVLSQIGVPMERPMWVEQLKQWSTRFGQTKDSNEPKGVAN